MKKLILTTLMMGAAMFGAVNATTIADISAEGDGNTDTDISVSWGRPVNIL